jgi:GT2 family glycosyltransferase
VNKNTRLLFFERNWGFAGGMNRLVAECQAPWVLLVGSDTVFAPLTLKTLVEALLKVPESVGIVGPVTNQAGTAQKLKMAGQNPEDCLSEWSKEVPLTEQLLTPLYRADFFCVAIRRSLWENLQGLDERYGRGYYEDFDFCLRARAQGFESAMLENAFVYHQGSATFSKDAEVHSLIRENKARFLSEHPNAELLHVREDLRRAIESYLNLSKDIGGLPERLHNRLEGIQELRPKGFIKRWRWQRIVRDLQKKAQSAFPSKADLFI